MLQALSVVLCGLTLAAAVLGDTDPSSNLLPTCVYVVFWLGLPALSVLLGNVAGVRVLRSHRAVLREGRPRARPAAADGLAGSCSPSLRRRSWSRRIAEMRD